MNLSQMQSFQAGGLGSQLDELDVMISRIGSKDSALANQLLQKMDAIDTQIRRLEDQGANIKAETGQYESACATLQKNAAAFVRDIGLANLRAEREKRHPPEAAWWWRLDEIASQKRKERLVRFAKWGTAIVLLLGVLVAAYQIFLAPSPEVMARYEAIDKTTNLAASGNYTEAMAALQKGLATAPDDPDLLLWEGVIDSITGKDQQANNLFSQVQGKVSGMEDFYLRRAQDYLVIGQDKFAQQDAEAAIQADPNSAQGYYILANVEEDTGDLQSALKNYQKTIDLANDENSTLVVEARVKMGYLLQGIAPSGAPTPTGGAGTP